jgi:hypothetical protein
MEGCFFDVISETRSQVKLLDLDLDYFLLSYIYYIHLM